MKQMNCTHRCRCWPATCHAACRNTRCSSPCMPICRAQCPPYPSLPPLPNALSVAYLANGGTGGTVDAGIASLSSYRIKSVVAANVSRPGYVFLAWNTEQDGSGDVYAPEQEVVLTENLTLYAQWAQSPLETFTVAYDANEGTGGHTDINLPEGSAYTIKTQAQANVARPYYTFVGWNTQADGLGAYYAPNEEITIQSDLILYALWNEILYVVTYEANGGYGAPPDEGPSKPG